MPCADSPLPELRLQSLCRLGRCNMVDPRPAVELHAPKQHLHVVAVCCAPQWYECSALHREHAASSSHEHTSAYAQVLEALHASSLPLSADQQRDYEAVLELYGTTRMMLAVLGKDELAQVVSGLACDFFAVLEPVRAVRPVHGGAGHDLNVLNDLRMLRFQIDPTN